MGFCRRGSVVMPCFDEGMHGVWDCVFWRLLLTTAFGFKFCPWPFKMELIGWTES